MPSEAAHVDRVWCAGDFSFTLSGMEPEGFEPHSDRRRPGPSSMSPATSSALLPSRTQAAPGSEPLLTQRLNQRFCLRRRCPGVPGESGAEDTSGRRRPQHPGSSTRVTSAGARPRPHVVGGVAGCKEPLKFRLSAPEGAQGARAPATPVSRDRPQTTGLP